MGAGHTDVFELVGQSVKLKAKPDYETVKTYELELKVTDKGKDPKSSTVKLKVTITDTNDNVPVWDSGNDVYYDSYIWEDILQGSQVLTVRATDKDSDGTATVTYKFNGQPISQALSVRVFVY